MTLRPLVFPFCPGFACLPLRSLTLSPLPRLPNQVLFCPPGRFSEGLWGDRGGRGAEHVFSDLGFPKVCYRHDEFWRSWMVLIFNSYSYELV